MIDSDGSIKVNKVFVTALISMGVGVVGSAAKAYMDVEKLKTRMDIYVEDQKEIKEDLKEIRKDIKTLLKG